MPEYPFECVERPGEHRLEFFSMSEAPKIGDVIERDGLLWVRVPAIPQSHTLTKTWRHAGLTSNAWHPWVGQAEGWHDRYDPTGRPQFQTKREAREFARRYSEAHPHRETSYDG